MTISQKGLEKAIKKYLMTLEPMAKDVPKKTEASANPDGTVSIKEEKGDSFMEKQPANAFAKAFAKAVYEHVDPHLGQTIVANTAFAWNYFGTQLPAGISPSALTALYQFDGTGLSLNDRSGNSRHLVVETGPESYCSIPTSNGDGYLTAMAFPEDKRLQLANAAHDADFRYLGACVIELLMVYEGNTGTSDILVDIGPPSHTEDAANNVILTWQANAGDGMFYYLHETGGGTNQPTSGNAKSSYCYPGLIQHLILNRTSGGDVMVIQNGVKVVEWAGLTLPTGGDNAKLSLGRRTDGGESLNGAIASARFLGGVSYTQAQWEESYKRLRGLIT